MVLNFLTLFNLLICSALCSSFAIGSGSVVKRILPDFRKVTVVNNPSIPKLASDSDSNGNSSALVLPALNLTSYVRQKKSTGLTLGNLLDFVPAAMRYEYLNKILPSVLNVIRKTFFSS
jgi:hypothetical protein